MVKMKLSRMFSLVLGLAGLLSQACGGDNSGPGGGTGGMGAGAAPGSGGATSSGTPSTCTPTRCKNDPDYSTNPQEYCDIQEQGPCGAPFKAFVACSLAHDTCLPDGNQDYTKIQASCSAENSAASMCFAAQPSK
jgi:hypothetical protein